MNMPTQPHYAVIFTDSVTIPGDERSRTNPGHGYPEHTVGTISYRSFLNKYELSAYILSLSVSRRAMARVIFVQPLSIKTNIQIDFE